MKKLFFIALTIITIFMCASCRENTPIESQTPEVKFEVTAEMLKEYTVVYPSVYNEYRMEDVYALRTSAELFCGADINVISDKESCDGKRIILASSQTEYFCKDMVNSFYGTLKHIIAVDENTGDIILGGANYYGDVLAIETFCDKYLAGEGSIKISGIKVIDKNKNTVSVTACMLGATPFLEYGSFSDVKKAGFNTVLIDASLYTEEEMHEFVRWCAIDNVDIVMRSVLYTDIYFDSPNVKGHLIVDEPYGDEAYDYYSKECEKYSETYRELSWKPYINIIPQKNIISTLKWSKTWFEACEKISFKIDVDSIKDMVELYSYVSDYASSKNKKFIASINVDMSVDGYTQYEIMRLMAYTGLCFGADGFEYFNYAVAEDSTEASLVDNDFNKSDMWHYSLGINYEMTDIGNILRNYKYEGAFMSYDLFGSQYVTLYGTPMYDDKFTDVIRIEYDDNKEQRYLAGSFTNNTTENIAYTILNLASESANSNIEMYVSTHNTRIWVDGNIISADALSDTLKIVLDGTECVVVEVFEQKTRME